MRSTRQLLRRRNVPIGLTLLILVGLMGGLVVAMLKSPPAEVQGNTISTTTASLQVSPDNVTYDQTMAGFAFQDIQPDGPPSPEPGYPVYLKNTGSSPLKVSLGTNVNVENPDGVDFAGVHIIWTEQNGERHDMTLTDFVEAARNNLDFPVVGAFHLQQGEVYRITFQVTIDSQSLGAAHVSLRNIVFVFRAVAAD